MGEENEVLVSLFLRGGCDGLNVVVPIAGEDRAIYESERPTLKIPIQGDKAALRLTDLHGFHPSAKPLLELFQSKKLALVHAAGITSNTRSHFDAQELMERGTPDNKNTSDGWLARYLDASPRQLSSQPKFMSAISVGSLLPSSLAGEKEAVVFNNPGSFNLNGKTFQNEQREILRKMYRGTSWLDRDGVQTLDAIDVLEEAHFKDYKPENGADYPRVEIGNRLKVVAQTLKMGLGVRVVAVDMGGWDTHKNQGDGSNGNFANLVSQLSQALYAFHLDLNGSTSASLGKSVTVVAMTEFGRRLKENANHGTDHGHGSIMMVLGEVNGGRIYGRWPGLKTEQLYERADLAVTTDFREVLAEILVHKFQAKKLDKIFPNFTYQRLGMVAEKT